MDSTAQKTDLKAIPANVNEIKLQPTSLDIWENKYCLKSKQGERIDENIDQTYQRVAKALVEVEAKDIRQDWYEKFLWAPTPWRHPRRPDHLKRRRPSPQTRNVNH